MKSLFLFEYNHKCLFYRIKNNNIKIYFQSLNINIDFLIPIKINHI